MLTCTPGFVNHFVITSVAIDTVLRGAIVRDRRNGHSHVLCPRYRILEVSSIFGFARILFHATLRACALERRLKLDSAKRAIGQMVALTVVAPS